MTDQQHPITPPQWLVEQWRDEWVKLLNPSCTVYQYIATQAARWGADQELKACCEWVQGYTECGDSLRVARRPDPPSLKEQALHILDTHGNLTRAEADTIRRALEALKEQVLHILDTYGNLTRAEADSIRRALEQLND